MAARKIAGVLALLAIAAAAWFSLEWARADADYRQATSESVARAAALEPRNTAYLALEALQLEYAGEDSTAVLERMTQIAPRASAPRIRLGLNAEARGDPAGAEKWLLDAARVDHQYEPRWTLANFYFRQQRMEEFWEWMRSALQVSYGNRSAAFDLCMRAAQDPAVVLARAVPEMHEVLAAWVAYLVWNGPSKDAAEAAASAIKLSREHTADDAPVLYAEMDRLLAAGRGGEALEIWKNLGLAEPQGPQGNAALHPDFEAPRIGHGFDWRLTENAGVRFTPFDAPPVLRISLDGMQPESCELLMQYASVRKGRRYRMRWESRWVTGGPMHGPANGASGAASGLAWHAGGANGPLGGGEDWTAGEFTFLAAQDFAPVALDYMRPLGETRVEGSVELRHVSVQEQP